MYRAFKSRSTLAFLVSPPLPLTHRSPSAFVQVQLNSLSTTRFISRLPISKQLSSESRLLPRIHTVHMTSEASPEYTLYYAPTPNGMKVALALEEMGLSYKVEPIHIGKEAQFTESFKAINPNSKIPAIVDHTADDLAVFESGAILEYLAEKTGKFLPPMSEVKDRYAVKQWLYWQMAGFGPMLGQMGFFWKYSKVDVPVGKERYLKEALRLFAVLDKQLSTNKYIAGDEYSIADMATYFWSKSPKHYDIEDERFERFENVKKWQDDISERPALKAVHTIPFEW